MDKGIVSKHLDAVEVSYIGNKHQGGSNNKKGAEYEDCFMTFKILKFFSTCFFDISRIIVEEQNFCYVDDLRIETPKEISYFQLKNSININWGENVTGRSIKSDFKDQFNLSEKLGEISPKTILVVSDNENQKRLCKKTPSEIIKHTKVLYFPDTQGSFNQLITDDYDGIKDKLRSITMIENPTDDVLEGTLCSLLMAKKSCDKNATVEDVFRKASEIYPTHVRPLPLNQDWSSYLMYDFIKILDRISDLEYGVERGIFHWNWHGTSGVFGYAVNSSEFNQYQKNIINNPPTDFDDFEESLP